MNENEQKSENCRNQERKTLERLAKREHRPKGIAPFEDFFKEGKRPEELAAAGAPVVGQFCNFVPEELVLAAGAIPLRLDFGCHDFVRQGDRLLQAEVCCAVRAVAGASEAGAWPLGSADLVVVPTACDGKKRLATLVGEHQPVFSLELPQTNQGERAREWWQQEIQRLVKRLTKLTGRKISRRSLQDAVGQINQRAHLVRRLNDARRTDPPAINGADALLVMQASFFADIRWWLEKTEVLVEELERRVASGEGTRPRARILLTGSPVLWPDFKLPLLVTECGADVVADELCSGTQRLHHPTVVDEGTKGGLIRAAAERVLLPCTCPCLGSGGGRIDRLVELIERQKVDGILHHTIRLCQLYDMDSLNVSKTFRNRGVPWLEVHTEHGPEDAGLLQNRIEAFVEMVQSQKE